MRPDEHKKKRSVQYNKKKGNTDVKKDGQATGKAGSERHPGGRGQTASSTKTPQQQQQRQVNLKVHNSDSSSDSHSPDRSDRRQTFKRREIVSNWSRYEVTDTTTEHKPSVATDYSKLLATTGGTGGASSHFRFKDETDWDLSSEADSQTSSILAIDLSNLASSLDSIPLYDRLGLSPELFTEEQRKSMLEKADTKRREYNEMCCHGDGKQTESLIRTPVDFSTTDQSGSLANNDKSTKQNLFSSALKTDTISDSSQDPKYEKKSSAKGESSEVTEYRVKDDLNVRKSQLEDKTDKSLTKAKDIDSNEEQFKTVGSVLIPSSQEEQNKTVGSVLIPSSQEEELDFLLSLGAKDTMTAANLGSSSRESTCKDATTTTPPSKSHKNNSVGLKTADNKEGTTSVFDSKTVSHCDKSEVEGKDKTSKGEDLEDWLDTFLDE